MALYYWGRTLIIHCISFPAPSFRRMPRGRHNLFVIGPMVLRLDSHKFPDSRHLYITTKIEMRLGTMVAVTNYHMEAPS